MDTDKLDHSTNSNDVKKSRQSKEKRKPSADLNLNKRKKVKLDTEVKSISKQAVVSEKKFKKKQNAEEDKPKKAKSSLTSNTTKTIIKSKEHKINKADIPNMKKKDRKEFWGKLKDKNYVENKEIKRLWEKLRSHDTTTEQKTPLCDKMFPLVKNRLNDLIFTHDMSRVVEALVQFGTASQRAEIFTEIRNSLLEVTKSKYGSHYVTKQIKYGSREQRNLIMECFRGHVAKLMRHSVASKVIFTMYNDFANANQRNRLLEEFYGPTYFLFQNEDKVSLSLNQLIAENPDKTPSILKHMKEYIEPLVEKECLEYSMLHRLLFEYLSHCEEGDKTEMIVALRENFLHLVHTYDGVRVAIICLKYGTAKDRKVMLKSMNEELVLKMVKDKQGYIVMLSIFDTVDDTSLVDKIILQPLIKHLWDLMSDQYGKKVIYYLIKPRDSAFFVSDVLQLLEQGESETTSKKPLEKKQKELLVKIKDPLIRTLLEHCQQLFVSKDALFLIKAILKLLAENDKETMENRKAFYSSIASIVCDEQQDPAMTPSGHLALKVLVQADQNSEFSNILVDKLKDSQISQWMNGNRGLFNLLRFMENGNDEVRSKLYKKLNKENHKKVLNSKETVAGKLLQRELEKMTT